MLYFFCLFCMYVYGFLSWGFTDRREILHGSSATSPTGLVLFLKEIAPGMAEFWASTGAIWRDMLVAEALVLMIVKMMIAGRIMMLHIHYSRPTAIIYHSDVQLSSSVI